MLRGLITAGACFGLTASALAAGPVMIDNQLPYYETASVDSGAINCVGSNTMGSIVNQWFERYERFYPSVNVGIESDGSGTAPPAMIEGFAQFGPMTRLWSEGEIEQFDDRFGHAPTQLRVGTDAMGIFVNEDNPIEGLTLDQLEQVFSVRGADMTWGDLGLTGDWTNQPVTLYGRNASAGAFGFFKQAGLSGLDFKESLTELPSSDAVVQNVALDKYSIGYSGVGYVEHGVKMIPLAFGDDSGMISPSFETADSGEYPLTRNLYLTVRFREGSKLNRRNTEFLKLVYSKQGQEIVIKDGFYPVSAKTAFEELKSVGIELGS